MFLPYDGPWDVDEDTNEESRLSHMMNHTLWQFR